jgi:hypothetical protein
MLERLLKSNTNFEGFPAKINDEEKKHRKRMPKNFSPRFIAINE